MATWPPSSQPDGPHVHMADSSIKKLMFFLFLFKKKKKAVLALTWCNEGLKRAVYLDEGAEKYDGKPQLGEERTNFS